MKVQLLAQPDFVRQRWRNGGGFTTELSRHPAADPPAWRVSVAEIARPGPFSAFPGCERTMLLLEGDGLELRFDAGPPQRITRLDVPHAFAGERKTDCRLLGGPVRVLNVITDRERIAARVEVALLDASREHVIGETDERQVDVPGECPVAATAEAALAARHERPRDASWLLAYALRGSAAGDCGGAHYDLGRGELLRVDDAKGLQMRVRAVQPHGALAVITLRVRRGRPRAP
jgi:environmental stress-induced protein Ves